MSGVYPFSNLADFERFRGVALEDPTSAEALLHLHGPSGGNSVVRIYYGPPGTGKTLTAVQKAVELADPSFASIDDFRACFEHFATAVADQVAFVTFHQALQYEDFVEAIRPVLDDGPEEDAAGGEDDIDVEEEDDAGADDDAAALRYRLFAGPMMRMIRRAIRNPDEQYVMVIDEINRGDISRILGPLISSIEPDKRLGADFPIGFESQFPRSGAETRIFMPANLHIIGTMNSADRNIALVDFALRRRFEFVEVAPEPRLLTQTTDTPSLDLRKLLTVLNRRIAFLLDKDHAVGHGYFMGCETNADLVSRFARRVLPLLAEYFYGNESALLLVLGDQIGGEWNVHQIEATETSFEALFGQEIEQALATGYRTQQSHVTISVDRRFWDPEKFPPGPGDPAYAVQALRKIYG
jgi:5-methylcytosine-specific restriction enzyme B